MVYNVAHEEFARSFHSLWNKIQLHKHIHRKLSSCQSFLGHYRIWSTVPCKLFLPVLPANPTDFVLIRWRWFPVSVNGYIVGEMLKLFTSLHWAQTFMQTQVKCFSFPNSYSFAAMQISLKWIEEACASKAMMVYLWSNITYKNLVDVSAQNCDGN